MLLSSMDHLNYYSMPKESFLELDTSAGGGTGLGMSNTNGYALPPEDLGVAYLNEENSPKNGTKSSLYKTELCKRFSEFGNCRYGAKCQFAHGIAELRHVVRHPKYKTTKCKSYWGSGHCPYGSRCRFIHEEVEGYSQPQYSPPNHLSSGMFMHEKEHLGGGMGGGMMAPPPPSSLELGSGVYGGGLYGEQPNQHHHLPQHLQVMSSYPKDDYSLLSPLDKGSWGAPAVSAPAPKLHPNYAGDHFGGAPMKPQQATLGSIGLSHTQQQRPSSAGAAADNASSSPSYPDLQDAIDALMKFSLTSQDDDAAPDSASPVENSTSKMMGPGDNNRRLSSATSPSSSAPSASAGSGMKQPEFSLQSDGLWKDFPTAASAAVFADDKLQAQHWPAGLSLSLDSKPFNGAAAVPSDAKEASGSGSTDEESPRLSVFERFH